MNTRVLLHIAFWLAYLFEDTLLEYFWIKDSFPGLSDVSRFFKALHSNVALLPVKLLFVYFLIFKTIDRDINKSKSKKLGFVIAEVSGMLLISILLHRLVATLYLGYYVYNELVAIHELLEERRVFSAVLDIGFVAGGAVAMKLLRLYLLGKEREKMLETEKLHAELKFLKTQTNPHFMFNTLNNIYALARKKSDDTANVVMKLSKLLRFMLYEARKNRISLVDEIHMIDSYLELERIRYNERLKIRFDKEVDDSSQEIAPMILLPFIENAFKHVAGETRFESFICIDLRLRDGVLQCVQLRNGRSELRSMHLRPVLGRARRLLQRFLTKLAELETLVYAGACPAPAAYALPRRCARRFSSAPRPPPARPLSILPITTTRPLARRSGC